MYDIIIIGAGIAGLTSAIYSLNANKKVVINLENYQWIFLCGKDWEKKEKKYHMNHKNIFMILFYNNKWKDVI